ncbi:MAG: acyloxyacyl hydrolase [Deltaproteobacteria bacterium]|nr:acyloxyacyl hydrolase [Deltaproteobacteria bacterium]
MVRRMWGNGLMVMVLAALVLLPGRVKGAEFDVSKFNQEVGLRFAYGKNTKTASVHLYSFLPRWGIFLMTPGKKWGPFGASFVVEGIASIAGADEVGFELGFTPMVKFSCLVFPSVLAYIEGGAGLITESINSPAIAHAFNFTPQVGGGFDIALTPQVALSVAYRFRHSSNAGIYKENPAFNVNFFQAGLNYYY